MHVSQGNKAFWDFFKEYKLESASLENKYHSKAAKYYRHRLVALAMGKQFNEEKPARNIEEVFDRGLDSTKNGLKTAQVGFMKFGSYLGDKYRDSGVKDKMKGLFGGSSKEETSGQTHNY